MRSADRPDIEFKVTWDVIESANFAEFNGFCDVTGKFKLHFQAIGWLYLGAAFDLSSGFFELFLMAISVKIGQVPHRGEVGYSSHNYDTAWKNISWIDLAVSERSDSTETGLSCLPPSKLGCKNYKFSFQEFTRILFSMKWAKKFKNSH